MSVDTIDELMDEAVTQGMIAMQLSMGDGLPGRHDKVIKKTKASLHSLLISKLPEKKPTNSAFEERRLSTPESVQNSAYNSAISDMYSTLNELFGVPNE